MRGTIERRLLVNYRVDPEIARRYLPDPFRPLIHHGYAVAGICLIRLAAMRPWPLPRFVGRSSENAAHRFAVEWEDLSGHYQTGVYIPRRDSDSFLNRAFGGGAFPGSHHQAEFDVTETEDSLRLEFTAVDGAARVAVAGVVDTELEPSKVFDSLDDASRFFERGSLGYSTTKTAGTFDGLRLHTSPWRVDPVRITHAHSSLFDDPHHFPAGSIAFDNALIVRNVSVKREVVPELVDLDPAGWPARGVDG